MPGRRAADIKGEPMMRRAAVCFALVALVAASCTGKGGSTASTRSTTATTAKSSSSASNQKFGTLPSPCGKAPTGKTVSIKAGDAGKGSDQLYIGVANERTNTIPGSANLLKEMWDSSNAFATWCNDQGGIDGLKISLIDLDAKVVNVAQEMATACSQTFAMVGGGWAEDNLAFTGQNGSDFYKCKMIAFPGFAVSAQFSDASGVVQAIPNPPHDRPTAWMKDLVKLFPDKMAKVIGVYGNVPTLQITEAQTRATAANVPGIKFVGDAIPYQALGANNWNLLAGQVVSSGAQAVSFVGQPGGMSALSQALKQQGWTGIMFADGNEYSPQLISDAGAAAVEGVDVSLDFHPFEEASKWPAVQQYLDIMKSDGPPGSTIALLGMQSWSSWLLFATSAKKCIEGTGDGQLSRDCVRQAASTIHSWDGGGLHATADPAANTGPTCWMIVTVKDGKWTRLSPKLGASGTTDGFSCAPLVNVPGDFGTVTTDPSYKTF